ncbi:hypothetical protein [Amycolatopsis sp. GM8]|uniref:hypothetical protein n=1 Tax=Amycolatopsis sp. GM8 TaxID=2896530 RepID=UPI001F3B85A0|nr:hypothetical protein [Amycolatopsis sp. GM8]
MWWGWLCAVVAAVAYGVASVLQAVAARAVDGGERGVDPRLLVRVFRQWRYVAGTGLDVLGFLAQLVALRVLPLFAVQAALAASLAVTAVAAIGIGARLRAREWVAVALVCGGLGLLGVSAQGEGSNPVGFGFHLSLVIAAAVLGVVGMAAGRAPGRVRSPALGLVAGLEFALVALAGRIVSANSLGGFLTDPATYAIAAAGALGMLFFASALQRGSVTTATALMVVGETVLPSVIGVLALGDTTRPGFGILAVAGFVLAVVSALALARFGEVS